MNNMKKIIALALMVLSLFALVVPASAATCSHKVYPPSGNEGSTASGTLVYNTKTASTYRKLNTDKHHEVYKKIFECTVCHNFFYDQYETKIERNHNVNTAGHKHIMTSAGGPTNYHSCVRKCTATGCTLNEAWEQRCSKYPGCNLMGW